MLIVCEVAAAHFARESAFEQGHAKELTALETKLFFSIRADLGEQMVNLPQVLHGFVSKRLQVLRHVEMQVLLRRLHQFQDLLFSESLAVFRVVVQEIGQPSLNGNGCVAISKKQLSQLGIVTNRTTDHSTMKTCFKADEQTLLLKKRCTNRRSAHEKGNQHG